jgi:myo-inositol 2-dehydrogenase / D-chiro-inositol 1-dehydrogenase
MQSPIRTLVVGVGTRGRHWVRLVHEEALTDPVGYVDVSESGLKWVQDTYGVDPSVCFDSLDDALAATRPDLVVLATPPDGHLVQAQACFDAGCHLLAEKPLTLEFAESVEIVKAADRAGRTLTVGLNFRYLPATLRAKELIETDIGDPSFSRFIYWTNRDGRRPGINKYPLTMRQPMLWEQSIHHFDLMRFVYNREIQRLWCRCHNPPWSMYADDATVVTMFEMDDDLLVNYFGTWSGQTRVGEFTWRTDCQRGSLLQRKVFSDLRLAREGSNVEEPIDLPEIEDYVDDTRAMLSDVARQLLDGVAVPHPSGIDHLRTLAVVAACEESTNTGKPVELAEFWSRYDVPTAWNNTGTPA